MFRCRPRPKSRKHPGATLVEMLIALIILAVMLLSIMAVIVMTTRDTVATKETQGAYLSALNQMEILEAQKNAKKTAGGVSQDNISTTLGSYKIEAALSSDLLYPAAANSIVSADITVTAEWNGAKKMKPITFVRQVSPSAWQNAGEMPPK